MKQFLKSLLASFLGTLLTLGILFFIIVGMISAITAMADNEQVNVKPNSVLITKLDYPILERTSKNPFETLDFMNFENSKTIGMNDILANIKKAENDPNIKGIYLNLSSIQTSFGNLEEIRNQLVNFKKSGKFIFAYSEAYTQGAYYLATVADKIFLNPAGSIDFKGLVSQIMFMKGLLDKVGIEAQIVRGPNNKFKSAVEPYMLDKMSEANREQTEKLLSSLWNQMLKNISESRNISIEDLMRIADNLEANSADDALTLKLVDNLAYKDEILTYLQTELAVGETEKIETISLEKYTKAKTEDISLSQNKLAVIYAVGEIASGKSTETSIGSESLSNTIRKARLDEKIKAIVFRVNSPGGSALASEVIRREIELAVQTKPVIVSMGNVAASGGYWISTSGNYIFADPTTLTGSIGVFGMIPNFQQFFNEKLGITFDKATTNKNSDFIDLMEPMSEFKYKKLQDQVVKIYDDFTTLVSKTRGLRQSFVDSIGQGRVWTGVDAIELGLVDELGGLEQAIAYAVQKAELTDYRIVELPEQKDPFQMLLDASDSDDNIRTALKNEMGEYYNYYEYIHQLSKMEGIQARLPFFMTIE